MSVIAKKIMRIEDQPHGNPAMPDSKLLAKNIIGAFLVLTVTLVFVVTLLLPSLMKQFSSGVSIMALVSALIVSFLITVPTIWCVQAIVDYRNARNLDRLGLLTKGLVIDKWTDEENGKPVYYVHYKYFVCLNAMQIVDKNIFQQLKRDESTFILYLDSLPHISRLDLD